VWWQLPSTRDDEKLQLLCSSVKQQVRIACSLLQGQGTWRTHNSLTEWQWGWLLVVDSPCI
jgi:hypothetical protein